MREALQTRMNLEMAVTDEMVRIAQKVKPQDVCLVPESRQEITTEGGLNVCGSERAPERRRGGAGQRGNPRLVVHRSGRGADRGGAPRRGSPVIELHTGAYAEAAGGARAREFERLRNAAKFAASLGLTVNAGHGLNYHNVEPDRCDP